MTREILFRGKRLYSDEWLFGDLSHQLGKIYVFPEDGWNSFDYYEVDPSTIGQYTGLTDKNGKKIFEGDIARYADDLVAIEWHDEDAMFYTRGLDGTNWTTNFNEINGYNLEIIGNIHDNPELLEYK